MLTKLEFFSIMLRRGPIGRNKLTKIDVSFSACRITVTPIHLQSVFVINKIH